MQNHSIGPHLHPPIAAGEFPWLPAVTSVCRGERSDILFRVNDLSTERGGKLAISSTRLAKH